MKLIIGWNTLFFLLIIFSFYNPEVSAQILEENILEQGINAYKDGNYKSSIKYFNDALRTDSLNETAYIFLSSSYIKLKKPLNADEAVNKGLKLIPNSNSLRWIKAELFITRHEYSKALGIDNQLYKEKYVGNRGISLYTPAKLKMRIGQLYQIIASQEFAYNKLNDALSDIKKAVQFIPDSLQPLKNLALIYLKSKNYKKAIHTADQALKKFGSDPELIKIKASAYYGLKDYSSLLKEYKSLYEKNPSDVNTALAYGELLDVNNNVPEAGNVFSTLLKKHPKDKKIYNALLELNSRQMNLKGELAIFNKMRATFPKDNSVLINTGDIYERMKNWKNAWAVYDTLILITNDTLKWNLRKAEVLVKADSIQAALVFYKNILKQFPHSKKAYRGKGNIEEKLNLWEDALATYKSLFKIDDDFYVRSRLGIVYEKLNQPVKAEINFRAAIDKNSSEPVPYFHLAKMLLNKNKADSSFSLSFRAFELSIDKIQNMQSMFPNEINLNMNSAELDSINAKGSKYEKYNSLSEEILGFLIDNFPYEKVFPGLKETVNRFPGSGKLHFYLGQLYRKNNQFKLAINEYNTAIGITPNLKEAQFAVAELYNATGKITQAIHSYERVLSIDPKDSDTYEALIKIYRKEGRLNLLCSRWTEKYKIYGSNNVLKNFLIEALDKAGRYNEARKIIANP